MIGIKKLSIMIVYTFLLFSLFYQINATNIEFQYYSYYSISLTEITIHENSELELIQGNNLSMFFTGVFSYTQNDTIEATSSDRYPKEDEDDIFLQNLTFIVSESHSFTNPKDIPKYGFPSFRSTIFHSDHGLALALLELQLMLVYDSGIEMVLSTVNLNLPFNRYSEQIISCLDDTARDIPEDELLSESCSYSIQNEIFDLTISYLQNLYKSTNYNSNNITFHYYISFVAVICIVLLSKILKPKLEQY
jgi:hypothetical protein